MMKFLYCFIAIVCIASSISAQSIYEAGYFINNDGKKTECLIKKLPWTTNPTEFEWKRTISSSPKTEHIEDIKEFSVGEEFRFKRYILEFDLNGDTVGRSTKFKDPNLKIRKIFLRIILKSKATLYQYSKDNVHRFFYTDATHAYPELLLYKVYYKPDETEKPGEKIIPQQNNTYQEQLKKDLGAKNLDVSKLTYTQTDLKNYFKKYNESNGDDVDYNLRKKINQTKIGIVGAIELVNFKHPSIIPGSNNALVNYNTAFTPRYGVFIETFIPFSKVDLSFFLEGTYRAITTTAIDPFVTNLEYELDFKNINVAFAPRFHIYLSSKFEFFLEGGVSVDFDLGTELTDFKENEIENVTTDYFYGGGFGSGRFKIGFRNYTNKNFSKKTALPVVALSASNLYLSVTIF